MDLTMAVSLLRHFVAQAGEEIRQGCRQNDVDNGLEPAQAQRIGGFAQFAVGAADVLIDIM